MAFASRKLHAAEMNYSVIDREALAIMYGVNKFFLYLAGNQFTVRTDHKPLLSLFHPQKGIPTIAASRMQRWAHFLSGFNYNIEHVGSQQNIADFPSRFPTESWKLWKEEDSYLNFINQAECGCLTLDMLLTETSKDNHLKIAMQALKGELPTPLPRDNPYSRFINELSLENGVVMRGHRIAVPVVLRKQVLEQLHKSHLGIVKSKSIARSSVWWPELDRDIEKYVNNCSACLMQSQSPARAKLIPWDPPPTVWSRIHADFAGPVKGTSYLILVDALSKWVEVFPTKSCTSEFVLDKLVECISRFGLFDELVSDNGTQFVATNVQAFLKANGIKHKLTSPGHPATNGEAENMVKTFKSSLLKCLRDDHRSVKSIVANFLIGYRKSIHCTTRMSPSQMMLGRDLRTSLDILQPSSTTEKATEIKARENIKRHQQVQVSHFGGTRSIEFVVGDCVIARDYSNPNKATWSSAVVVEVLGPRNYNVRLTSTGRVIKRHLDQLRKDTRDHEQGKSEHCTSEVPKRELMPVKRSTISASPDEDVPCTTELEGERNPGLRSTPDVPEAGVQNSNEREVEDSVNGREALSSTITSSRSTEPGSETEALGDDRVIQDAVVLDTNDSEGFGKEQEVDCRPTEGVGPSSNDEEAGYVSSEDEDLVVSGFARGYWRLRDLKGRIFRK